MIRIATRQSAMALWQAHWIEAQLAQHYPNETIEVIGMTTQGDETLDVSLTKVGGKGLFIKELEHALLNNKADIAVHCVKDLTVHLPADLSLTAICKRDDPRDALVSNQYASFSELPHGAIIGTSSLRRQCQLRALRPDLTMRLLRGNVNTRLKKLDNGDYDAILLAQAGLERLDFHERIKESLSIEHFLPAVGQGALAIECRRNDQHIQEMMQVLHHQPTAVCIEAERAMNRRLNGSCQVPIGGYAELHEGVLHLKGMVGQPDGSVMLQAEQQGTPETAVAIGIQVAEALLAQGADKILAELSLE